MACKQVLAIIAAILVALPASASAKQHVVGDDHGWRRKFDYEAWAADKEFQVGDTLVFKYNVGSHNVFKVNGSDFQTCTVPPPSEGQALASGYDVITLATPGRKWYICGKAEGKHCKMGQKLFINVVDPAAASAPAPVATPPSAGRSTTYVVGDNSGWTPGFNYTAWAQGKQFKVGDSLVFKYPQGYHNVYRVSGPEFQQCQASSNSTALTSGNDVVTLATSGRKWYICGVSNHCELGQKLVITVIPASSSKANRFLLN